MKKIDFDEKSQLEIWIIFYFQFFMKIRHFRPEFRDFPWSRVLLLCLMCP